MKNPKKQIKSLNPLKFVSVILQRNKKFKKGAVTPIPESYAINNLAEKLHPVRQFVKISEIQEWGNEAKTYTFVPDPSKGTENLAYFSAGQYISIFLDINGIKLTRAYSLSSSPKQALEGKYKITVKNVPDGLVSNFINENWKEGASLEISAPQGHFEYVGLRDAKTVVCIAGGSGITPFYSMAQAIKDGDEDFNLTLLYGSKTKDSILFRKEFDELQKSCHKIKVIHVLSNEEESSSEYEKGFINAQLIKKYAPENEKYSVFLCGPQAMYNFVDKELEKLNLEKKYIRHELFGEPHKASSFTDYPAGETKEIKITVSICDKTQTVTGSTEDTILQTLEKNGVLAPSRCRSGECGWCHSFLKSGSVFIPKENDVRRKADEQHGFIHPCCTFPLSDIEIEVPLN